MAKQIHVLIVEDDQDSARVLQGMLAQEGPKAFKAEWVETMADARARLEKGGIDVCLLDLILPDSKGSDTVTQLCSVAPDLPIVVVSGLEDDEVIAEAMQSGAQDYLVKGYLVSQLLVRSVYYAIERKRIQDLHEEKDHLLRTLMDSIPDTIYFKDMQSRFTLVNEAHAAHVGGLHPEEMVGKSDADFFTEAHASKALQDEQRVMETGEPLVNEEEMETWPDGRETWMSTTKLPLYDRSGKLTGSCGVSREITARKEAEQALAESEGRFRELVRNMSSGVAVYEAVDDGADFVFRDFNAAAERIEGIKREEVMGRRLTEVFPGVREFGLLDVVREVWATGKPAHLPVTLYADDRVSGWRENYVYKLAGGEVVAIYDDVTERKRAEQALVQSEERYSGLYQNSNDAIFIHDLEGKLVDVNRKVLEWFGYSRKEIMAMNISELHPPEALEECKQAFSNVDQQGHVNFEVLFKRKNGETFPAEVSAGVFEAGGDRLVQGIVRDITERRQAVNRIRDSEHRYRFLVENAPVGVMSIDLEGRIVSHNQRLVDLMGFPSAEAMRSLDVFTFTPMADAGFSRDIRKCLETGAPLSSESWYTNQVGKKLCLQMHLAPSYDYEGKVDGVQGMVADVTAGKEAEERRKKMEVQLQQTQKLESLGVLAGGIAHDFNNLLMGVLGNADLALDDLPPDSPARVSIEEIENSAKRAADLCRQMLAYAGKGRFVVGPVNLKSVVEEMKHMLSVSVSKTVVIKYNFAANVPLIEADASQVGQIVMNLVTNASEAISERSGLVSVSTGAMHCDRDALNDCFLDDHLPDGLYSYLEVADTGCGMNREVQQKVFDPFFTTKFTGRGLGLAAVMGIVRAHNGTVKIYSEPGRGTTFRVLFPASEHALEEEASKTSGAATLPGGITVLLVDDEETVRTVAGNMLERSGVTVKTAADGREALAVFREEIEEIDCVILDLTMPHMNGEETFRELRRLKKNVRVILSSGYNEQEATLRFAGSGLAGFIQKPYDLRQLRAKLADVLSDSPA